MPLIVATFARLRSAQTKASENDLIQWRRINELAATLYNKENSFGLWSQLAAAHELGEVDSRHRGAAKAIIVHARIFFAGNPPLAEALEEALARVEQWRWR